MSYEDDREWLYKAIDEDIKPAPLWGLIWLAVLLFIIGLIVCSIERRAEGNDLIGEVDLAPWLPEREQLAIKRQIPQGVPVGSELKFYKLQQVWQSLYTMNGGQPHRDVLPVTNEEHPWRVSGGMSNARAGSWRNATGLSLPMGAKIEVWEEWQDVGAFGPVPKVRWRFPDGTLAYDVLFSRTDNAERVFEVRVHRKRGDGEAGAWDSGTRYAPVVEREEQEGQTWQWSFPDVGIACRSTATPAKLNRTRFEPTKRVHVQDGVTPHGYLGAGTACNVCHDRVGERTGYATGRRGDDGRFSWHPFANGGRIDERWPIASK